MSVSSSTLGVWARKGVVDRKPVPCHREPSPVGGPWYHVPGRAVPSVAKTHSVVPGLDHARRHVHPIFRRPAGKRHGRDRRAVHFDGYLLRGRFGVLKPSLDEGAPRHAPAPLRRRSDTVLGEDPLDSVASEFMSEVLECASQARISPRRVLLRHAHNELTDVLRRRRSAWAPVLAAIVLGCDEAAVPTQKRSGCGNGRNLGQRLAA